MKAMVLHAPDTPFVLEERPDPVAGEGEIVARVLACGSGLTIHHAVRGRTDATFPRVIGHEILGEIAEIGTDVAGFSVGDRVTTHAYITCGYCKWCKVDREPLCDNLAGFVAHRCRLQKHVRFRRPARRWRLCRVCEVAGAYFYQGA